MDLRLILFCSLLALVIAYPDDYELNVNYTYETSIELMCRLNCLMKVDPNQGNPECLPLCCARHRVVNYPPCERVYIWALESSTESEYN